MSQQLASDVIVPPAEKTKHWWQTARAIRVLLLLLVAAAGGGWIWWNNYFPYVSTDDARVAMNVVRLAPSGSDGRIIKVNVQEGSHVEAGQVLLELDHRAPEIQLQRAQSQVEFTEKELRRVRELVARNGTTTRQLDSAKANYEAARADLAQAQLALENTTLKSPIKGVVIQQLAEVGNILARGQTATTIVDADNAWIAANIQETNIGLVKPGQPVDIHIDEGADYHGKVSDIRTATASEFALIPSDNASGNFTKLVQRIPIKIALDAEQAAHLRIGQSAEIKIRVR